MDPNQLPQPGQQVSAPQSPATPETQGQFNPAQYDFITNPTKPPKKTILAHKGLSKGQRVLIVIVGFLVLFILLIMFFSFLSSSGKPNATQLKAVVQQQAELARVSDSASTNLGSDKARNIAAKVKAVMISQQNTMTAQLKTMKIKISSKELLSAKNAQTDQDLATAQKNGRYDDAYIQAIRNELEDYKKTLQTAFNGSKSKSTQAILNEDYKETNLLLEDITGQPQT